MTAKSVVDWLLDADPAIRWQVMRDVTHEPADVVAAERALVGTQGWGARLLALQAENGLWAENAFSQDRTDTFHVMELLRRLGLDPDSPEGRQAVDRVRTHVTWGDGAWWNPPWAEAGFFEGEVEPCINGNIVATGSYFGVDMTPLVERLLGEQLDDGGWNCEVERGATVSSFGTTINVVEGLLAYERSAEGAAGAGTAGEARAARERAEAYMLERRLFRRKSTGEVIDPEFLRFSWPTWWQYDVLRGLDHLRDAGHEPADERLAEAMSVVESKRDTSGRWPLEQVREGATYFDLDAGEGQPSRWITLLALRVLDWSAGPG